MRKLTSALCLAFALGGLAPMAVSAGDGCDYGGKTVKKNDLETPMPTAETKKKEG